MLARYVTKMHLTHRGKFFGVFNSFRVKWPLFRALRSKDISDKNSLFNLLSAHKTGLPVPLQLSPLCLQDG